MVAGGLETFDQADAPGHDTFDPASPLFSRIQQPEFDGVHLQFTADLIDQRFHSEGCLG